MIAATLATAICGHAGAEPARHTDLSAYGQLPAIDRVQISPSGQRIAYLFAEGDRRQIKIKDLSGALIFTGELGAQKVRDIEWAGEDHLVIITSAPDRIDVFYEADEYRQAVVLSLASRRFVGVFSTGDRIFHAIFGYHGASQHDGRWFGYFGGVALNKTRGFEPTLNESGNYADLYRVDLDTGEEALVAAARGKGRSWALGPTGEVVATSDYDEEVGLWRLHRGSYDGPVLSEIKDPLYEVGLQGLGRTPGSILINDHGPQEWSLADAGHAEIPIDGDVSDYLYDPKTRLLVGADLKGDRMEQVFFDPALKSRQAAVTKALGGDPRIVSWSTDRSQLILYTDGQHDAGTYWLLNGGELKPYAYSYPKLEDAAVGETRVVIYKAQDGVKIHGVLTLPPGRDARRLPLIVLPHGGPEAHDSQGFDWWAQAFAGRGYAVFQPNFRGSDGYGLDFREAGFGQWGRKMQTDISDGVAALAAQGMIDPRRACIVGGSYGGYAALAGVTIQHGLYRCAVAYGAVTDPSAFLEALSPSGDTTRSAGMRYLTKFMGVRSIYDPALRNISPVAHATEADAPILLIHGADDTVVPIAQSRSMERALRRASKTVESIELKSEDHWLSTAATRQAMLSAAVAFVEKNNPAD